jgi:alkanesulfonate monooxygenase SsuD/methylene tetrahydromethanopterin reductase-like flavin-dependent oxidoreductase (luciferase family)
MPARRIAVGLPTGATGGSAREAIEWAGRAEDGPFSSVGVLDRGVGPGFEPLTVLAAVASATTRLGLITSIVLAPTRETTLLARQATTVDALSGGRLSLGVAVGTRQGDYRASGADFRRRGRVLDEQLPVLRRLLRGEPLDAETGAVGSPPVRSTGAELLVGGYVPAVARRIAAWADGFVAPGGGDLRDLERLWAEINREWGEAGRAGRPRWVGAAYYALGPRAHDEAARYIDRMYGHDPPLAARRLAMIPTDPDGLRRLVDRQADAGVDELLLRPVASGIDQLERLADAVG